MKKKSLTKLLIAGCFFILAFGSFNLAAATFLFGTFVEGEGFFAFAPGPWCVYLPTADAERINASREFRHYGEFYHNSQGRSAKFVPVQCEHTLLPQHFKISHYDSTLWYQVRHPYLPLLLLLGVMPLFSFLGILMLLSWFRAAPRQPPAHYA